MGVYEGLAAIAGYKKEQEERKAAAQQEKINYLNIPAGKTYKIWFLQELDRSAENYDEEMGLGVMATEHSSPEDFRRKASCSMDSEEQCIGCEKHKEDWRAGWKAKPRLYINVLVEDEEGKREVAIMSQPNGAKAVIVPMLLKLAVKNNTVTDRWWEISREGIGPDTSYSPLPDAPSKDIDPQDYKDKLMDVKRCFREIPYDEQFDHFFADREAKKDAGAPSAGPTWGADKPAKAVDEEW